MSETETARLLFLAFFGLLFVLVWTLPRRYVYLGAPDDALWRDLRLWAGVLIAIHVFVYALL